MVQYRLERQHHSGDGHKRDDQPDNEARQRMKSA
jgi:hypothetical protein